MRIEYSPTPLIIHFWSVYDNDEMMTPSIPSSPSRISSLSPLYSSLENIRTALEDYVFHYLQNYHLQDIQPIFSQVHDSLTSKDLTEEKVVTISFHDRCFVLSFIDLHAKGNESNHQRYHRGNL